ncbi:hypothetical protein QUF76_07145 [Desulfobacterales bacterium HSG16]|nr:hypothetical protein [Desulfobacterales bacterium HSG16]
MDYSKDLSSHSSVSCAAIRFIREESTMSHNPDITPDIDHLLPYLSFLPFFMKDGHVIALSQVTFRQTGSRQAEGRL